MTRTMLPDFKMDQAAIGYCPRFDAMGRDDEKFAFEACGFWTLAVSCCADPATVEESPKRQNTKLKQFPAISEFRAYMARRLP